MLEEALTLFYLFDFIPVSVTSIVDILIVAFVFYQLLGLIRGTRAAHILVGLFLIVSVAVAAPWLKMGVKNRSKHPDSSNAKNAMCIPRVAIKIPCKVFLNSDVLSFLWLFLHVELGRGVLMRSRKPLNRHSAAQATHIWWTARFHT